MAQPQYYREETGWPRVDGGDDITPPVSGGRPAADDAPADGGADANKISRLDHHRAA